jgi:TP901 family phage tail tape measure protein
MVNIGTLRAYLTLDDQASVKLSMFASNIDKTTKRIDQVSSKLASSGAALTAGITAPLVGLAALAVQTGVGFTKTMNTLGAVANASVSDMKRMQDAAIEWGNKTAFSAKDAADAMLSLSKAGFTTDQAIGALPDTLNLASAANMSLGEAADLTSNVMKTFGFQTSDLAHANDVLVAAANA